MRRLTRHGSSLALTTALVALTARPAHAQSGSPNTIDFTVLSRGQAVGSQSISVSRSAEGWTMNATGSMGPPFDLTTSRLQLRYSPDWQPLSLVIEATHGTQLTSLRTTFTGTTARTEGLQRGVPVNATHTVSPGAVIVPTGFYPAYEALAARLVASAPGAAFRLFIPPLGEVGVTLARIIPHRLSSLTGTVELRQFDLVVANPGGNLDIEIWTDTAGRLARLAIPASWFVMIRSDLASVMTREETIKRPGDQELYIPGLGFEMAATVSRPAAGTGRLPAVVLVGAAGQHDRDERTAGVPVFADLAAALSDAGFVVVRYDKRGAGRSGGRTESATVDDYAGDALSAVQWLRRRQDVDPDRIAIVGYAEGAAMALLAAQREKKVAALCLIAPPGQTGRDITLRQQQQLLAQSNEPPETQQAKIALQTRVIDAVIKGSGWEGIAPEVRQQAETAWFRSWLTFNPAAVVARIKQPMLIITGERDTLFPPDQADRLLALGLARKNLPARATEKIILPDIDHALAGPAGADGAPAGSRVSPAVLSPIVDWLKATLPARKP